MGVLHVGVLLDDLLESAKTFPPLFRRLVIPVPALDGEGLQKREVSSRMLAWQTWKVFGVCLVVRLLDELWDSARERALHWLWG